MEDLKTNFRDINLCRSEGERDLGLGSWTGDASWCRDGGVATEDLLGGVTSCKESQYRTMIEDVGDEMMILLIFDKLRSRWLF